MLFFSIYTVIRKSLISSQIGLARVIFKHKETSLEETIKIFSDG